MSDRSWFYAAQGQQQGPFPEAQFRNLIARNTVTADTLVWTDGMSGWQRAGDIPGLMGTVGSSPAGRAAIARPAGRPPARNTMIATAAGGGPLSFEPGLWEFLGQGLLYVIGILLVVPAPWLATGFYRWVASRRAGAGSAELRFQRPADGHLVGFRRPRTAHSMSGTLGHLVQSRRLHRARIPVVDDRAMDRRAISVRTDSRFRSASTAAR